jgi:hypothetical protein
VLLDPNEAAFGIIPVVSAEASPPTEGDASREAAAPVGCISWLDLTVSDASATRDFYRQVVDWSVQDIEMEDGSERYADYNTFPLATSLRVSVAYEREGVRSLRRHGGRMGSTHMRLFRTRWGRAWR